MNRRMRQTWSATLGALLLFGGCGGSGGPAEAAGGATGGDRDAAAALGDAVSEAGRRPDGGRPDPHESFVGSRPTLAALGSAVLDALVAADTVALEGVRLTEGEHNEVVWPELPAADPSVGFPVDVAWENIQVRNRRDLGRLLPRFRGRTVAFQALDCRGPVQRFETFHVLGNCWLVFEDFAAGRLEAQVFEHVLVRAGGHKIFRYDADRGPGLAGDGS